MPNGIEQWLTNWEEEHYPDWLKELINRYYELGTAESLDRLLSYGPMAGGIGAVGAVGKAAAKLPFWQRRPETSGMFGGAAAKAAGRRYPLGVTKIPMPKAPGTPVWPGAKALGGPQPLEFPPQPLAAAPSGLPLDLTETPMPKRPSRWRPTGFKKPSAGVKGLGIGAGLTAGLWGGRALMNWLGERDSQEIAQISPYAAAVLKAQGLTPPIGATVAGGGEPPSLAEQLKIKRLTQQTVTPTTQAPAESGEFLRIEPMGFGYVIPVYRMPDGLERRGQPIPEREAFGTMSTFAQAQLALGREKEGREERQWTAEEARRGQGLEQSEQGRKEALAWAKEQVQLTLAAKRETELANLRANPQSWLESAILGGTTPAIQPWMLRFMPQDYSQPNTGARDYVRYGGQPLKAGAPLPNWRGKETNPASMLELTTPSLQSWAQMGPDAQQQYLGYERMRTGASPEEQLWKMRSTLPPGGNAPRLTYRKPYGR